MNQEFRTRKDGRLVEIKPVKMNYETDIRIEWEDPAWVIEGKLIIPIMGSPEELVEILTTLQEELAEPIIVSAKKRSDKE